MLPESDTIWIMSSKLQSLFLEVSLSFYVAITLWFSTMDKQKHSKERIRKKQKEKNPPTQTKHCEKDV